MPLFVVAVDKKIIPDHNTIDRERFLTFLREFLLAFTSDKGERSPNKIRRLDQQAGIPLHQLLRVLRVLLFRAF